MDSPNPVPLPGPLVVKNGSVALAKVAASMPDPVSAMVMCTYSPGASMGALEEARPAMVSARAEILKVPPAGMASRAFKATFSKASSS